jgi:SAM-dependent methyltransferase
METHRDTPAQPWYVTAFQDDYRQAYAHRDLPSARHEVDWIVRGPLAAVEGTVLDLCCGFGRHSLALVERGFRVAGLDLSQPLLRAAQHIGEDAPLAGRVVRGDMARLPFRASAFGAVVNLFTSFGYLGDDGDRAVLAEVARVLVPGGVLVMDLMNPAVIRRNVVPHTREERDGLVLEARRTLSDDGRRVAKEVQVTGRNGESRSWREDVRMYEPRELDALLGAHGLAVVDRRGDFDGGPYDPDSLRQIVHARRSL